MTKRLYFGNLSWDVTEEELSNAVAQHATVVSARVITDRDTGRSRGFGFVEVEDADAQKVIDSLNGADWHGRQLTVNEAREREERSGGGGGGAGAGGRGGQGGRRPYGRY
ncbi:MAG: RNA-binding protein [Bacillota bacterium]|jgi:RNA recognition motif-containing protein|nr:RNA-binding protein [Bacillota bacterium]